MGRAGRRTPVRLRTPPASSGLLPPVQRGEVGWGARSPWLRRLWLLTQGFFLLKVKIREKPALSPQGGQGCGVGRVKTPEPGPAPFGTFGMWALPWVGGGGSI